METNLDMRCVCTGAGNLLPAAGRDSALWVPSAQQLPSSASSPLGLGIREQHKILQVSHAATVSTAHLPVWQLFISYDAFMPDHAGEQLLQLQWINGHQKDSLAL